MPIAINDIDGQSTVSISGELTIFMVAEYQKTLLDVDIDGSMAVDLREVEEIDAAGVQLLLAYEKELQDAGEALLLGDTNELIDTKLGLLHLDKHFAQAQGGEA